MVRNALHGLTLARALVGLGLVLVAINVASAIWDIRMDRERVERRAVRDFANITSLLAAQGSASLETFGRPGPAAAESFEHLYKRLDLGEGAFVTLLSRTDGIVIARVPEMPEMTGKPMPQDQVLRTVASVGRYEGWAESPITGRRVLLSAAAVPGFPLIVISGASEEAVLAPWRADAWAIGMRTLLASVAMLAIMALAAWGLMRREQALARAQQRLRQAEKLEAVGRLAGGIAHDFNNILGGILGYAEMLVEGTAAGTALRRYAANVLAGAGRAASLVEQILTYSRSQRHLRVPVALDRIAAETTELLRGSLPAGIGLEVRLPAEPVGVLGDATQLHQITMNLCTNAIHAMGEHGRLVLSLVAEDVGQPRVLSHGTLEAGRYARLSISDSGSGMDDATLARIFEPFFTTKEVGKGTGLGLALVYGIVTDSGGGIDVASTPGGGSAFTIYLPRVVLPPSAAPQRAPEPRTGAGQRVMLVEDEASLAALTTEILRRLGYEPVAFSDGASALEAFRADPRRFDAVVTDEVMARLSGTELAGALREARPELPVILVSGYIGALMSERAAGAGIREILRKPVQARELAAALERALAAGQQAPAPGQPSLQL
ncbi:MAG: ATP-binding protein [Clostridia bacterium]